MCPSGNIKHDTLSLNWFNVDPSSATLNQHQTTIDSISLAFAEIGLMRFYNKNHFHLNKHDVLHYINGFITLIQCVNDSVFEAARRRTVYHVYGDICLMVTFITVLP